MCACACVCFCVGSASLPSYLSIWMSPTYITRRNSGCHGRRCALGLQRTMPLSFSVVMAVMTVFDDALSFFQSFHAPKERDPDHGFCTCPVDFSNEAGAACSTHISARDQTKCVFVCVRVRGVPLRERKITPGVGGRVDLTALRPADAWPSYPMPGSGPQQLPILPRCVRQNACAFEVGRADWRAGLCVFAICLQPHPLQPYRTSSKVTSPVTGPS